MKLYYKLYAIVGGFFILLLGLLIAHAMYKNHNNYYQTEIKIRLDSVECNNIVFYSLNNEFQNSFDVDILLQMKSLEATNNKLLNECDSLFILW